MRLFVGHDEAAWARHARQVAHAIRWPALGFAAGVAFDIALRIHFA